MKNKIKINFKGLKIGGKKCTNPYIEYLNSKGLAVPCQCDNTGQYTVQLEPGDNPKCLTFRIACSSDCVDCESVIITKCLCEDVSDCNGCEDCVGGFCVSQCDIDEVCDDKCGCTPVRCFDGKTLIDCECKCPTGTFERDGKCVGCDDTTELPCDKFCRNGVIIDRDCDGDNYFCTDTCDCRECCADAQCDQTKGCQVCTGSGCQCCDGYVKNTCTGECVPILAGWCRSNSDCGDCSTCRNIDNCTGYGLCTPTQCPQGYICVEDKCVEECDCNIGFCSSQSAYCASLNEFTCYCKECPALNCEEGDGGCEAASDRNCVCIIGSCGPNPCGSADCIYHSDCRGGSGESNCYCDGGTCKDNPCNNSPCSKSSDCQGAGSENCTCQQGVCVPTEECPPISCTHSSDCQGAGAENCICVEGQCITPEGPNGECNTNLSLEKIEDNNNCDLKASLDLGCCPCPALDVELTKTDDLAYLIKLYKDGTLLSTSTIDDFNTGNELPSGGSIGYKVYREFNCVTTYTDSEGNILDTIDFTVQSNQSPTGSGSVSNTDTSQGSSITVPDSYVHPNPNTTCTPGDIIVEAFVLSSVFIPGSECNYRAGQIIAKERFSGTAPDSLVGKIYSSDCKNPIFQWRKDGEIIRRIYVDGEGNYMDTLKGPDGEPLTGGMKDYPLSNTYGMLESCHDYTVEVDCDCGGPVTENIIFCKTVEDFTAESLNKCATRVKYDIDETCDINKDLDFRFTTSGEYTWTRRGSALPISDTIVSDNPIEWVKLEMLCEDGSVACEKTITFDIAEPTLTATYDCPDKVTFPSISDDGQCAVDTIVTSQGNLASGGVLTISPSVGSLSYTVTWVDNCKSYEGNINTPCTCADDPCNDNNYQCGQAIDICGNVRNCGSCPPPSTLAGACSGGVQRVTNISYSCQNRVCIENRETETITGNCPQPQGLTVDCGTAISFCPGESSNIPLIITGGAPTYSYTWTRNGQVINSGTTSGTAIISVGQSGVLATPGVYVVNITDALGTNVSCTLTVYQSTPSECGSNGGTCSVQQSCTNAEGCNGTRLIDSVTGAECQSCNAPSKDICGVCGGNNTDPNDCGGVCTDTCNSLGFSCGLQIVCGQQISCGTCSNSTRSCPEGLKSCPNTCTNGVCSNCTPPACDTQTCLTCSDIGAQCGIHSDGCGGTLNCGSCGTTSNPDCPAKTCTNSCLQTSTGYECASCVPDSCDVPDVQGCIDVIACNYNSNANISDNSCEYCSCAAATDCSGNCETGATETIGTNGTTVCVTCSGGSPLPEDCDSSVCESYQHACGYTCPGNSNNCDQDCQGSWSTCSATTCDSQSTQTYTIIVPATGNGAQCPFNDGESQVCFGPTCATDPACCTSDCGGQSYDPNIFGCCNGSLIYNLQTQKCCTAQGTVVGINDSCDLCQGNTCSDSCQTCDQTTGNCTGGCTGNTQCCNGTCESQCLDGSFPTSANNCECVDNSFDGYAECINNTCEVVNFCSGTGCFIGTGTTQVLANQAALDACNLADTCGNEDINYTCNGTSCDVSTTCNPTNQNCFANDSTCAGGCGTIDPCENVDCTNNCGDDCCPTIDCTDCGTCVNGECTGCCETNQDCPDGFECGGTGNSCPSDSGLSCCVPISQDSFICCTENGGCAITTSEVACTGLLAGTVLGPGDICDPNPCCQPVLGLCCDSPNGPPNANCQNVDPCVGCPDDFPFDEESGVCCNFN